MIGSDYCIVVFFNIIFMKKKNEHPGTLRLDASRIWVHKQSLWIMWHTSIMKKAFDRVKHTELFKELSKHGIDGKDPRIVRSLYWEHN